MTQLSPFWRELRSIIVSVAIALLVVTAVRAVFFQPYTIPSSSMSPGLLTGDYIVVSKSAYGWSKASLPFGKPDGTTRLMQKDVKRGDVVVFRLPRDTSQVWIKRVIGLPGDVVDLRDSQVFINGNPVPRSSLGLQADKDAPARIVEAFDETLDSGRSYVTYENTRPSEGDYVRPITVPAGHYLVMGDNRDNSLDGRWSEDIGVGLLPAANLIGRADVIAVSWKPGGELLKPWTWHKLRLDRLFKAID